MVEKRIVITKEGYQLYRKDTNTRKYVPDGVLVPPSANPDIILQEIPIVTAYGVEDLRPLVGISPIMSVAGTNLRHTQLTSELNYYQSSGLARTQVFTNVNKVSIQQQGHGVVRQNPAPTNRLELQGENSTMTWVSPGLEDSDPVEVRLEKMEEGMNSRIGAFTGQFNTATEVVESQIETISEMETIRNETIEKYVKAYRFALALMGEDPKAEINIEVPESEVTIETSVNTNDDSPPVEDG